MFWLKVSWELESVFAKQGHPNPCSNILGVHQTKQFEMLVLLSYLLPPNCPVNQIISRWVKTCVREEADAGYQQYHWLHNDVTFLLCGPGRQKNCSLGLEINICSVVWCAQLVQTRPAKLTTPEMGLVTNYFGVKWIKQGRSVSCRCTFFFFPSGSMVFIVSLQTWIFP